MQGTMSRTLSLVVALAGTIAAGAASADPMTYTFQSGQIRVEASTGATVLGLSSLVPLDGSSVTIDTDAGTLNDLSITSSGPVDITLSPAYLDLVSLTLTDLALSGGPGALSLIAAGPPDLFSYHVDPLLFAANLDASAAGGLVIDDLALATNTGGSGFISLDTVTSSLFLQGVTIGQISPLDLGLTDTSADDLVLKADFTFTAGGVIPEPDGARLMGLGILIVAVAGLAHRRRMA